MPCNSDYMNPTNLEINLSNVYQLLDELETGILTSKYNQGYDYRVYNRGLTKTNLDELTEELCSKLQNIDVTGYSLELQIWWRNHKKADEERLKKELELKGEEKDKIELLNKLTPYERKLLKL